MGCTSTGRTRAATKMAWAAAASWPTPRPTPPSVAIVAHCATVPLPTAGEQLFKSATQSWCPSPEGYPQHCCYSQALKETLDGGKATLPKNHLLQVFPDSPVFSAADRD